ncbi:MAG TPA: Flp pilus assembly complex ATPase component TadA [Candidatus Hydrogenedentes bacterium]|nr:Flp pilus assembly complex ATPase component TadA [Candidatus Hydrogenedentota bacterium]
MGNEETRTEDAGAEAPGALSGGEAKQQDGGGEILDMEQAIALLKTTRPTFYRWLRAGKFKGMKVGRQWRFYRKDIEAFLKGEGPRIALTANISPLLGELSSKYKELGGEKATASGKTDLEQAADLTAAIAVRMGASDVHIHPYEEGKAVLRMRVDGVLHTLLQFDLRLLPPIIQQWKALTAADINEKYLPQDGRGMLTVSEAALDVRTSFLPTALGESITMRILRHDTVRLELDRLAFSPRDVQLLQEHLKAPAGVIVVTGPTGSGKTTTLYSALQYINRPEIKIMTVEDPVEYLLPGIVQTNLRPDIGMTFPVVLLRFFRSDPDVMMVGEIRDTETLEMCVKGAVAGHLLLTTLHSPDAVSALQRIRDIIDATLLKTAGDVIKLVVAQRLVRTLCESCSVDYDPPQELLDEIEMRACTGGLDWDAIPKHLRKAVGCSECAQTGYKGRTAVAEALAVSPAILDAVRAGAPCEDVLNIAVEEGMTTMAAHGILKAAEGITTVDEVTRVLL